jgi:hypothetical protein
MHLDGLLICSNIILLLSRGRNKGLYNFIIISLNNDIMHFMIHMIASHLETAFVRRT